MVNELFLIIISPICAAIGYICKYFLDRIEKAKEGRKTRKLKIIEDKLRNFFYPFHSNLKRENIIYLRILSFFREKKIENNENNENNELYNKIFWGLDNEILKIHNDNQELIKKYFIEMHFSNEIANIIIKYDEHVSIYRILRNIIPNNQDDLEKVLWPGDFGSEYPVDLLEKIEIQMIHLQNQQTYILQGNNIDITHKYFKRFQYRKISNFTEKQRNNNMINLQKLDEFKYKNLYKNNNKNRKKINIKEQNSQVITIDTNDMV